jgi:hypothetical protein
MGAPKKILPAAEAARLLAQEFARQKPAACATCKAPTPFWGPGVVSGTGYWYLRALPPCDHDCDRVIARIWSEITTAYEIERSASESGRDQYRRALRRARPDRGAAR